MDSRPSLSRREAIGVFAATSVLLGMGYGIHAFSGTLAAARRRVSAGSAVIPTRLGALEFSIAGRGRPLMMIHGTGGGFDQGLSFASGLIARGHRIVAPSRFGYLRSDFPADASSANQADGLVELLDRLGIERLPVAGGSAGALSAVQLALRHPDRCSGLILLVPAANVSGRDPVEMTAFQEFMVEGVLNSDFLYWAALNTMPDRLVGTLLATDPALLAQASAEERRRAYRILEEILPISGRVRGMRNDAQLAGNPAQVEFDGIRVPTLVISVEDDRFGTAATAREIARAVPGAELIVYPSGGHIWLGHDGDVADEITRFIETLPR